MPATTASAEIAGAAPSLSSARPVHQLRRALHRQRPPFNRPPAGGVDIDEQGPADLRLLVEEGQQPGQRATQLPAPGRLAGSGFAHRHLDPVQARVERMQVAVFLVVEVVVERLPVEPGMRRSRPATVVCS